MNDKHVIRRVTILYNMTAINNNFEKCVKLLNQTHLINIDVPWNDLYCDV